MDGRTLRRSYDRAAGRAPRHPVSAWVAAPRLTAGQLAVAAESNAITAALPLLAMIRPALVGAGRVVGVLSLDLRRLLVGGADGDAELHTDWPVAPAPGEFDVFFAEPLAGLAAALCFLFRLGLPLCCRQSSLLNGRLFLSQRFPAWCEYPVYAATGLDPGGASLHLRGIRL